MKIGGFSEIRARFNSLSTCCGNLILEGDVIGCDFSKKLTRCAACWKKMKAMEGLRRDRAIQEEMKLV